MSPSALRSSFRSALCVASVLAALSAPARAAEPPPWEARARGALVHAETVYVEATAVLVGDQRTLVAVAPWIDAGRAIELRVPSATGERVVEAATRQVDHPLAPTWLLTSPVDVAAEPLTLSEIAFAPGVQVFVFAGHAGATRDTKLVATMIASTTAESEHVRVTGDHWSFVPGSPVLDQDGRLMGFLTGWGAVVPARALLEAPRRERSLSILPLVGYRLGVQFGGLMDGSFILDFDAGITLDDRVTILARTGLGLVAPEQRLLLLPERDGLGPARVEYSDALELRAGLEARYRFYLGGGSFPFYLDLAAGLAFEWRMREAAGPAFRSTEPGCDPAVAGCPLRVDPAPDLADRTSLDASFGIDLRAGPIVLGYRFLPGFGAGDQGHVLTFGASFF